MCFISTAIYDCCDWLPAVLLDTPCAAALVCTQGRLMNIEQATKRRTCGSPRATGSGRTPPPPAPLTLPSRVGHSTFLLCIDPCSSPSIAYEAWDPFSAIHLRAEHNDNVRTTGGPLDNPLDGVETHSTARARRARGGHGGGVPRTARQRPGPRKVGEVDTRTMM